MSGANGIFVCYRRDDARWPAQLLARNLADEFGADRVFIDVYRIGVGNWRAQINAALAASAVIVVVIGPTWREEVEKRLGRTDEVLYEIGAAIEQGKQLVPVLVERASIPASDGLPDEIAPTVGAIVAEQAYELGQDQYWDATLTVLLTALIKVLGSTDGQPAAGGIATALAPSEQEQPMQLRPSRGPSTTATTATTPAVASDEADWSTGARQLRRLESADAGADRGALFAVAFSPDADLIAAGHERVACVWDLEQSRELTRVTHSDQAAAGNGTLLSALAFGPDGVIASGGTDYTARLWDARSGRRLAHFAGPPRRHGGVRVALSADGLWLAMTDGGKGTEVFSVARGKWHATSGALVVAARDIAFDWNGGLLATISATGLSIERNAHRHPMLRAALKGKPKPSRSVRVANAHSVLFSPDGQTIAVAADAVVHTYAVYTDHTYAEFVHGDGGHVTDIAFSPDGRFLASASTDATVCVWDARTGRQAVRIDHDEALAGVSFSRDGTRLATAVPSGIVSIWQAGRT